MSQSLRPNRSGMPCAARPHALLGLLALCSVALGPAAPAQETAPETAPAAAPQPPPKPASIPLSEITKRFDEAIQRTRETDRRIAPEPGVEKIEAELPARHEALAKLAGDTRGRIAGAPSLNTLELERRAWATRKAEIDAWRQKLADRIAALARELDELDALQKIWQRTVDEARAAGAPAAVLERAGSAVAEIGAARTRAEERRNRLLALQDRVAREEELLEDVFAQLDAAKQSVRGQLLQPDAPPLWSAAWRLAAGEPIGPPLREAAARQRDQIAEHARRTGGHLGSLAVLAAIFLSAAFALRNRVRRWSAEDPDLGAAIRIFERPIAIAALISLISIAWLYPLAPDAVRTVLVLLIIVPVLRLLPTLIDRSFHPLLYALLIFYVTDELREMLEAVPDLARIVFALEISAGVGIFAWLLRPARLSAIPSHVRLPRFLGWGLRALLGLLIASLAANLLGYVTLATILGTAPLRSSYAAVVLYCGVQVTTAVLQVALHTRAARALGMVRMRGPTVLAWCNRLLVLGAALWWGSITLRAFDLYDNANAAFRAVLDASLGLGTIQISVRDVASFGLVIAAAVVLSKLTRFVLQEDVYPRTALQRGASNAISMLLHYIVLTFGFLLALGAGGIEMNRFALLAGAFGVGLGFGLQTVVNNFVSGLLLLFERPIQVGDIVQLTDLMGEVRHIGIRASTVRTFDGAEVIVPNGSLISDQVINWTRSDPERRIELPVGVAYGTDPERVLALLVDVARTNPNVLDEPEPQALFDGFGNSSLDFRLRAWVPFDIGFVTRSELAVAVNAALREAGIEIPFPQRDLHLRSVDAAAGQALAGRGATRTPEPGAGAPESER
ncbi:MAG: mechanosensitive ion channel [Deltaproteobacteria bacterium]|nr:MAG: mechanosensitive ion channel [Deltaproteobacteria bacterium]